MSVNVTPCLSCSAPIIFARSENGESKIPLNAEPVEPTHCADRNHFVLRGWPQGLTAVAIPQLVFPDEPHYISHFATCSQPERWRGHSRQEELF